MIKPWIILTNIKVTTWHYFLHLSQYKLKCNECYNEELINVGANYSYKQDV